MEFWISQIIGIVTLAAVVLSMQMNSIKAILIMQLASNLLGGLSYVFLGAYSACAVYFAAVLQAFVYFIFRIRGIKPPKWLAFVFFGVFIGCSLLTFAKPQDAIVLAAALICALALTVEKPSFYRILMLMNGILWSIYDVTVGAYAMIVTHMITSASALAGIIIQDVKKKKGTAQKNDEKI